MKVLLIDVNCKGSSTGAIVYNLHTFLSHKGVKSTVCYGRGKKYSEKGLFKFGIDFETVIHAFLTRITGYTGCYSFFSTKRLIRFIESYRPDIIHIHELHAYFVNISMLLRYLSQRPYIVIHTLHCEFSYTGKCGHSIECEKWKTECYACKHLRDYPASLFFDHTSSMYRQKKEAFSLLENLTIVTPSSWLAKRARESIFKKNSISIIHNGIDTKIFFPHKVDVLRKQLHISQDEKVIISVASNLLSTEKGGRIILDISQRLINQKIRFILIGTEGTREKCPSNTIMISRINNKSELSTYYSLADAFLMCSKKENYPTTCLEAQACGTPVIGFDTGGTAETLVPCENNHLVEYGDINQMIEYILSTPQKKESLSIYLHEQIVKTNSLEAMESQYYKLYCSLCAKSKRL